MTEKSGSTSHRSGTRNNAFRQALEFLKRVIQEQSREIAGRTFNPPLTGIHLLQDEPITPKKLSAFPEIGSHEHIEPQK